MRGFVDGFSQGSIAHEHTACFFLNTVRPGCLRGPSPLGLRCGIFYCSSNLGSGINKIKH